jgi:hypothetical protein
MTTKRILELTEDDEPINPYAFGPNASIQRGLRLIHGLQRQGLFTREPFDPGSASQDSPELRMLRRLKGRVL